MPISWEPYVRFTSNLLWWHHWGVAQVAMLWRYHTSLIFMSGRGLEANPSNANISRTICTIHFQLSLVTSLGSGTSSHAMGLSYLIIIHEWAGLRSKVFKCQYFQERMSHSLSTCFVGCPIISTWSALFLVLILMLFMSGQGLEPKPYNFLWTR